MPSPAVALTKLSIRDFRGIESLDLDFLGPDGKPNQLVVLSGPNGSGKTTVLEAALIVAGGHVQAVGPRDWTAVRRGAGGYRIVGLFRNEAGEEKSQGCFPGEALIAPFGITSWYFPSSRSSRPIGSLDITVGKYAPADKIKESLLRSIKQRLVNEAAKARFRPASQDSSSFYDRTIERISNYWRQFYPDSKAYFEVDFAEGPPGPEPGIFDVFLVLADHHRLEVDYLSSGQLEIFLFLASLTLNGDREGIVFIDEPELHLDPQWHRLVLRILTDLQPRTQFLVATHSPEVYDAARSYERHYLAPADDPRAKLWHPVATSEAGV
ncbi:AAA family ATPase [Aquisphaera insulae]|uniref:AAA family ATPase n=1 Tax=Aquisphaera insulae TaxID=2712864 RepID=UPI0013EBFC45|nr:ATP-binding protein [Aquisphaera insulae]